MADIEESNSNRIISGKSSLRSSIRPISATSGLQDPSEAQYPDVGKQRYLDVSNIFKNVFPDLTENSLGERRENLLKQAEYYKKRKLHQEKMAEEYLKREIKNSLTLCEDFDRSENGTSTRSSRSSRVATPSGSQCSARTSAPSEIEKDYLEDEAWHQKMVEYLAQATEEFHNMDEQLTRAERYIIESRGRAASADENRRGHFLEPLSRSSDPDTLGGVLDEACLTSNVMPSSLILPSEFYPEQVNQPYRPEAPPRYAQHTENSKIAAEMATEKQNIDLNYIEIESKTSSVQARPLKPRIPKQTKEKKQKAQIKKPSLSHKGYSREEDEEHKSIERHLERMKNTTFDFLKNPRSETPKIKKVFEALPSEIRFDDWEVGTVIETVLELRNNDAISRAVTVLPPENPHFHLGLGRYPSSDGQVGPGLSVLFRIQFMPDSLADDESSIEVRHQAGKFIIPIRAIRAKPLLTIPPEVNVGHCLVGSQTRYLSRIINQGGRGKFCFVRQSDWPAANFKTAIDPGSCKIGPFTIWPSMFELEPFGEKDLIIQFDPGYAPPGIFTETVLLTCDNCQTKEISIIGTSENPQVKIHIDDSYRNKPQFGEIHDRFALDRLEVPTGYPGRSHYSSYLEMNVQNLTHVDIPFNFSFVTPELIAFKDYDDSSGDIQWNASAIQRESDHVSPFKIYQNENSGLSSLPPDSFTKFCVLFHPNKPGKYNTVLRLSLYNHQNHQRQHQQSILTAPQDSKTIEYEIIGECKPLQARIMPQIMSIPGQIPAGNRLKREFYLINQIPPGQEGERQDMNKILKFSWHSSQICSIEPAFGCVPPGQSFPLQLCIEADQSGNINEKLICDIENGSSLEFEINAIINEPKVILDCGKVDFGIIEVGKPKTITFKVLNRNPIQTEWAILTDNQEITVAPTSTILEPLDEILVEVRWSPSNINSIDNTIMKMFGATHNELLLCGQAIRPLVQFDQIVTTIPDTFVGVPASFELILVNKSPLQSEFHFVDYSMLPSVPDTLQFRPAPDQNMVPLEPYERRSITIALISFKKQELSEFIIAVDVKNALEPALIEVKGQVRILEVDILSARGKDVNNKIDRLEFELSNLYDVQSKRIKIKNKTGIKSKFKIRVETLNGNHPKVNYEQPGFKWLASSKLNTEPNSAENVLDTWRRPSFTTDSEKREDTMGKVMKKFAAGKSSSMIIKKDFVKQMNSGSKYGVSVITDVTSGDLNAFGSYDVNVIVTSLTWGEYRDKLIIEIDDMEPISVDLIIHSKSAPITWATKSVMFGGVPASSKAIKKIPLINVAPHPISINLYVLTKFEQKLFEEFGEIPLPLDDEEYAVENSIFNFGESMQTVGNFGRRKMPFACQRILKMDAEEQVYLDINFDNELAEIGTNEAVLIGQLSLDLPDRSQGGLFHRSSGVKGPKFDLGISAMLEENRCHIETIDDLSFSVLLTQLESQRRAFSVYNPTRSTSKFTIHVPEPFRICDSNDGNLQMDMEVKLAKSQRRVYYLHFSPCEKSVEKYFICNGPIGHVMTCHQTMVTKGLSSNYEFAVRARVCLPNVGISRKRVDFAIRTVNEVYKLEMMIENASACETAFEFTDLDDIFTVNNRTGMVKQGQPVQISILFAPKAPKLYEKKIFLKTFGKKTPITLLGRGSKDRKYSFGSGLFY